MIFCRVRLNFQSYSVYKWNKPSHVLVFANMPPTYEFLSSDKVIVLEILIAQYNSAIRSDFCTKFILDYNGKFVKCQCIAKQASYDDATQLYS